MAAALVLFMQDGFLLLEASLTRSRNSINIAQKNIADFMLTVMVSGGFGLDDRLFAFDRMDNQIFTCFVFQVIFRGAAATIASGATAGRTTSGGYLIIAVVITSLIYPMFGHWAWGNLLFPNNRAWLAGIIVLGPRLGKFRDDGTPVPYPWAQPGAVDHGAIVIGLTAGIGYVAFTLMDMGISGGLRVSRERELHGPNETEHGTVLGTDTLLSKMLELGQDRANLESRLDETTADDSAELAHAFNRIMDNI